MSYLVSILIPAYNVSEYISKCIESILVQTYQNIEVIIVNDGSSDDTLSLCKRYQKIDSRIKVYSQKNEGVSSARNRCISLARGEFVAFVDPDDYIKKDYIQALTSLQTKTGVDIVACNYDTLRKEGIVSTRRPRFSGKVLNTVEALGAIYCHDSFRVYMWAKLIRRSIFSVITFPKVPIAEDQYACYDLLVHARGVYYTDRSLYVYRVRQGSICAKEKHSKEPIYALLKQRDLINRDYPNVTSKINTCIYFAALDYYNQYIIYNEKISKEDMQFIHQLTKGKLEQVIRESDIAMKKKMQALLFECCRTFYVAVFRKTHSV